MEKFAVQKGLKAIPVPRDIRFFEGEWERQKRRDSNVTLTMCNSRSRITGNYFTSIRISYCRCGIIPANEMRFFFPAWKKRDLFYQGSRLYHVVISHLAWLMHARTRTSSKIGATVEECKRSLRCLEDMSINFSANNSPGFRQHPSQIPKERNRRP